MEGQQITNPETMKHFFFAGNAKFSPRSTKSGQHFTFRVRKAKDSEDGPWFVSLLFGADNESDFVFMGTVFSKDVPVIRLSKKSRIGADAASFKAINWFLSQLDRQQRGWSNNLDQIQFWHEGVCARCGRTLTVPESIATGFGPTCAEMMGVDIRLFADLERPRMHNDEDDEQLPDVYDIDPIHNMLEE